MTTSSAPPSIEGGRRQRTRGAWIPDRWLSPAQPQPKAQHSSVAHPVLSRPAVAAQRQPSPARQPVQRLEPPRGRRRPPSPSLEGQEGVLLTRWPAFHSSLLMVRTAGARCRPAGQGLSKASQQLLIGSSSCSRLSQPRSRSCPQPDHRQGWAGRPAGPRVRMLSLAWKSLSRVPRLPGWGAHHREGRRS